MYRKHVLLVMIAGLAAVALTGDPSMQTLSASDVSAGLPAPAAAAALLGCQSSLNK